jgi:AcrR family transcriptional regulator
MMELDKIKPMDAPTLTRTQRKTETMRRTLVEHAEALLIGGGAAAVTAEEVARRADVSLQTVYNRVGGKNELLLAVAERAMEETRAYVDAAYNGIGSPKERALRIFEAYVRFAYERPHQFRILVHPPEIPEAISSLAAMAHAQVANLVTILRDGKASGWLDPALDAESTAYVLWTMMDGVLSLALRTDGLRPDTISPQALIKAAWNLVEFGASRRAPPYER